MKKLLCFLYCGYFFYAIAFCKITARATPYQDPDQGNICIFYQL